MRTPKRNETLEECRSRMYNSPEYKRTRRDFIRFHPLCDVCLVENKVKETEHTHHIVRFMDQPTEVLKYALLVDEDNIMPLCEDCHSKLHHSFKSFTPQQQMYIVNQIKRVKKKYEKMNAGLNLTNTVADLHRNESALREQQQKQDMMLKQMSRNNNGMNEDKLFE